MANRESAMTTDGFALETELDELVRTQTRLETEEILVGARAAFAVPSENGATQAAGLEWRIPRAPVGEPSRSNPRRGEPSRRQLETHRHAYVLGDSGYQYSSTYTWASGTQGSIFSLPEGDPPIARPPRAVCTCGSESNLPPPGLRGQRSKSNVRGETGYSLFPPPLPTIERNFAQERYRANSEGIHGGPNALGQSPTPLPGAETEGVPVLVPLGQGPKDRGCLGPVVGFWRGVGRFLSGRWA
ncbi:hypothetical protein L211DRAFT_884244 [Terfezia boudieri ATCC MYA-4762]|uniref:Uncharacterized protein n=1 Tax=Terfezia boudieri ATCC MYA-4762 TaxID=1051890 RepID=A0A3N4LJ57_9PEZI|nr:hypothetical protein L211DRAFT_884244 [Terfezia boudieri ATCC MYA-4762]